MMHPQIRMRIMPRCLLGLYVTYFFLKASFLRSSKLLRLLVKTDMFERPLAMFV